MPSGKCFKCAAPLASATVVAVASKAAHRAQAILAEAASGGLDPIRTDVLALVVVRAGLVAVDLRAEVALRGLMLGAEAEGVRSVAAAEPDEPSRSPLARLAHDKSEKHGERISMSLTRNPDNYTLQSDKSLRIKCTKTCFEHSEEYWYSQICPAKRLLLQCLLAWIGTASAIAL